MSTSPSNTPRRVLRAVCAALLLSMAMSCASAARADRMVPEELIVDGGQPFTVRVATSGGEETDPMLASEISDEALRDAVVAAIARHGVFEATSDEGGDYVLHVSLLALDQPVLGFDMTVGLRSDWMLLDGATETVVWREEFASSYTASFGSALIGTARLRLANEGAARENIRQALQAIAVLPLGPP